jgi:hypothetical protein
MEKIAKIDKNAKNRKKLVFLENFTFFDFFGPRGPPIAIYRFIEISSPQKAL